MKTILYLAISVLPGPLKRFIYNQFLGHEIHHTARIGLSFVQAKKIKMGPNSCIGSFNVIRNLELLSLGENSTIGKHNRASALPLGSNIHFMDEQDRYPALIIGRHTDITGKHVFDCNNTITLGDFTIVAGQGTLFYTHGINVKTNRQESGKISIGNYCMIGASCVVIKGAVLPDCSVLAANSTLHKAFDQTYMLYSGVPAQPVKQFSASSEYFHRKTGYVG
jgi:acyl-[acyl carrier protein]--UDP-N-acetylglucosamine O-acyltransferase